MHTEVSSISALRHPKVGFTVLMKLDLHLGQYDTAAGAHSERMLERSDFLDQPR